MVVFPCFYHSVHVLLPFLNPFISKVSFEICLIFQGLKAYSGPSKKNIITYFLHILSYFSNQSPVIPVQSLHLHSSTSGLQV